MNGSSLIFIIMPVMTPIALLTCIALPLITDHRSGRSHVPEEYLYVRGSPSRAAPHGLRTSRTARAGSTTHQGTAPRHGRRSSRPRRHGREVHPSAPPVRGGASACATISCSPDRLGRQRCAHPGYFAQGVL